MPADNVWDAAIQLRREAKAESTAPSESTLLFVGSRRSGKTSITHRFVERSDVPKPSLALEYTFARRTRGTGTTRELCHLWELAGGSLSPHLLEIPVTRKSLPSLAVVLVVDLSVPEELWATAEALLKATRSRIEAVVAEAEKNDPGYRERIRSDARARVGVDHPDADHLKPFPVPLLVVGTKYDVFRDFDPEKKKVLCRFLRGVAHVNCGSLLFTSLKSESSVGKLKAALARLAFRSDLDATTHVDYNKPLNVSAGQDSFRSIGGTLNDETEGAVGIFKMQELWKYKFLEYFPQVEQEVILPDDPGRDPNFKEKDIDVLRAQKEKELEQYRKEREWAERTRMHLDWD